jgi:hypothetical protein
LLRVLLVRFSAMPADSACTFERGSSLLLCAGQRSMSDNAIQPSRDWLASTRMNAIAWWLPHAAIVAALVTPVPLRAAIWIVALIWMGTACILNARRCRRTHCRYTGPYYLAMSAPVLLLATDVVSGGFFAWLILGVVVVAGGGLIWWASERAWGKFS